MQGFCLLVSPPRAIVLVVFLVFSIEFRRKMERFRIKQPPCPFRSYCK